MDAALQADLRFAIRRYLAARPTAALPLDMIRHAVERRGFTVTDEQVRDELAYWVNLPEPHVQRLRIPHTADHAWQITSVGRLADQAGE